jgi:hypothetical protein
MADSKLDTTPLEIIPAESGYYTEYIGSKEQLIEAGYAEQSYFPEGKKRKKYCGAPLNGRDYCWVTKIKGGRFIVMKNHEYRDPNQKPQQKPYLTLVKDPVSQNTVAALAQLLTEATRGEIVGIAFVAMRKGRRYFTHIVGEAYHNPTFARGMVAALDDELRDMVYGR